MSFLRIAAAMLLLGSGAAAAQTAVPAGTPAPAAPAADSGATTTPATDLTKDGKPRMKVVRAQCRDQLKAQDLKGDARRQAMADCIIKQRPDMTARIKCRMDPKLAGMDKAARRSAVQACVAKAKG